MEALEKTLYLILTVYWIGFAAYYVLINIFAFAATREFRSKGDKIEGLTSSLLIYGGVGTVIIIFVLAAIGAL